jgi:hypothetical protein
VKKILIAILLFLSVTGMAAAYPNNYTLYVSFTTTDGNVFNYTFHITGNMLPPVPNMPGVLHSPTAIFAMGSTRFNYQWQGVCPTCDMNDYSYPTANYILSCGDIDGPCDGTQEVQISCQVLGLFLTEGQGGSPIYNTIYFRMININQNLAIGVGNPQFGWKTTPRCTPATSPPDWVSNAIINPLFEPPPPDFAPYYKERSPCFRAASAPSGSPWTCSPITDYLLLSDTAANQEFLLYGDGHNYNCTNRDRGYTGHPFP